MVRGGACPAGWLLDRLRSTQPCEEPDGKELFKQYSLEAHLAALSRLQAAEPRLYVVAPAGWLSRGSSQRLQLRQPCEEPADKELSAQHFARAHLAVL